MNKLLFSLILLHPICAISASSPPDIEARSYILQDFHSGEVLVEKDADKAVEPASLTKLMTAYIVFNQLQVGKIKLTDKVKISEEAWRMGGSKMYLEVNSMVTIKDLLKGMIIQSGNDASIALSEHIAGNEEEFASLMNKTAERLGLTNTHYTNSTGLNDPQHYSSARDVAKLAYFLIRDFPEYYRWYSQKQFTYNNITQHNRNLLLRRDPSVDGMKTGFTKAAGYCLAASAKRKNMRLISVVLGTANQKARATMSKKLLDYGFRAFKTYALYPAYHALSSERVWQGDITQLKLGLKEAFYITVPRGQYSKLRATLYIDKYITAPVTALKSYGSLKIRLDDKIILKRHLVALSSVEKGSFGKRMIDSFLLLFH
ncbi:D-alanyl-D-alanine carboxypeptidase family protein [Candidatus Marithrix sp. Canyon 246]|uniref:D-alanyl-D-alanine carboxypeptidase family protein n=1 Tax=Candidatus Marithrix sp. Canyon 246 TaxID=1827136 RepID=UPI00084A136D|nr:D-alanyl-D-alanine carboxypeptidase family protein [Candidatus Marithrix sp. Canyon 246]